MAGNPIDLVVTTDALKGLSDLISRLEAADKALLSTVDSAAKLNKAVGTITTPQGLNANSSDNAQVNAQLKAQADIVAKLNREIQDLNSKLTKLNETKARGTKLTADEIVKNQELRKEAIAEAKANSDLIGSYQKLNIEHQKALKTAKDAGVTYGITSKEFQNASTKANQLGENLKKIDAKLGQHTRNVGNYSSAWNGLGNALGSLGIMTGVAGAVALGTSIFNTTKELESLELALKSVTKTEEEFKSQQIFLAGLAEKNGLEIKSLTKEYTAFYVAASGKLSGVDLQSVFSNISKAGSALGLSNETLSRSFQAVNQMLSKGTVASEELRGQLAESLPGAVQAMTKAVQVLHPEIKNLTEKGLFEMIKNGKILAAEVLPEMSKQLLEITGADKAEGVDTLTKSTNRLSNAWTEMVQSINNADTSGFGTFVKSVIGGLTNIVTLIGMVFKDEEQLTKQFLNIGKQKGLEEYEKVLKNISGTSKENQEAVKKEMIARERENIRVNQAIVKAEKEKRESIMGGDRALFHLQTKQEEDALVQIGKSAQKLKSISESYRKSLPTNTSNTIEETDAQRKARLKAEQKAEEDRLKALAELRKKEIELELANIDLSLNNTEKYYTERLYYLQQDFLKRNELAKINYEEELRLAKGNQVKEKTALINFQLEKLKLLDDYNKKAESISKLELKPAGFAKSKDEKDPMKQLAESAKLAEKALEGTAKQMEKNRIMMEQMKLATDQWLGSFSTEFLQKSGLGSLQTFFDGTFNALLQGADNSKEKFAVTFNAIAESVQEAFNFISNASQANFDAEYERLESQKDIAISFAGDSASAKKKIEEDFDKKKREIANREAKAKKKQAMFNIAIDTAQAVISLWANPGFPAAIPLSITVGALGALQLGMVAAQKVPQYWKGTDYAQSGLAWTNEKGAEIHTDKYGNIKSLGDNNGARLTMMEQGDKVFTASESQRMLQDKMLNDMLIDRGISMNYNSNNTGLTYAQMKEIMNETLGNKPEKNIIFDKNGFSTYIRKSGNITRYTNQRASGIGMTV